MFDNRNGISFEETKDPKAISVGKSGPWRENSRDPARKSDFIILCIDKWMLFA